MSDHDLRSRLSALHPPAPSGIASARALHRATLALASHPRRSASKSSPFLSLLRPLAALAAAALLLALGARLAPDSSRSAAAHPDDPRHLLAQLNLLFPGQLNSLVETDGTLRLDLAPSPALASPASDEQLIILEFTRADRRLRVLAFSGRPVRLELDGVPLHFDPLLTTDRAVVLSGENFVWLPGQPAPRLLAGWQLAANQPAPVL